MPPDPAGRSGRPGNQTTYKPVNIRTPHPEKLRLGTSKPAPSPREVLGSGVPSRQAGKFTQRPKNTGKKHR